MSTSASAQRFLNSLQGRFIVASLLCMPLFIVTTGMLLETAFKENLQATEEEQLQSQLYILLGAAEVQSGLLWMPEVLPEPRYSLINSGLYAQILEIDPQQNQSTPWERRWRSASARLLSEPLPLPEFVFQTNNQTFDRAGDYFRLTYDVQWEDPEGTVVPLRFQIYHSRDPFRTQLSEFRKQLWYGLSFISLVLLGIQLLIMRWGLQPLKRLVRDLRRLPRQKERQLRGLYPKEIAPVTDSLNAVLNNEQLQRERYQNTLSDLAHSLKTPLAIVQGELEQNQLDSPVISEQVERMNSIIRHQLQRAVLQTNRKLHTAVDIRPVVERLCSAMGKVYQDKGIQFDVHVAESCRFPMETQDLFELLGNLIENACKYGRERVRIEAHSGDEGLTLVVADDGAGLRKDELQNLLQRGKRADTSHPGQGLGLAITADIVDAYRGSIDTSKSSLGGACFTLHLPLP